MEQFNRSLHGYNPEEVNAFLDQVITRVESMINELKEKDKKIIELELVKSQNVILKEKIEQYDKMEATLSRAIMMAEQTSEQIKLSAHKESEIVLEDAKRNASRIINEALLKSERTIHETDMLKRNINVFKRRLKNIIESQLEVIDDIEQIEL